MPFTRLCIVRSTLLKPKKSGLWFLGLAVFLSVSSFAGGFTASHYLIDCELADSTEVLHRSAHAYEAEQTFLFAQWAESYAHLSNRIAAIPQRKEVAHHDR